MNKKDIIEQIINYAEGVIYECNEHKDAVHPEDKKEIEIMIRDDASHLQAWVERL